MKLTKNIRFDPGPISLRIIKFGLPVVIFLFAYIIYCRVTAKPDDLLYITRELRSMVEHGFMSLVILCGGAAAFEAASRSL
jgi:hypothetical protein